MPQHAYDVIVVGGGASGMMAAGRAAERGKRVLLLEKNSRLGRKLSISGGGRCNIFNAEGDVRTLLRHYGKSEQFLYSPFSQFGMNEARSFFEARGLGIKVEARLRAFPESEKAEDVVRALTAYLAAGNVEVKLKAPVDRVLSDAGAITGVVASGITYTAESYIFAAGGVSHPETGSSGDGFAWLRELGHAVENPSPSIVPLKTSEKWAHSLAGVTLRDVKIIFFSEGKRALALRGDILLTHFGISGPTILNAAGKIADLLQSGEVTARIDTQPDTDLGILDKKITSVFDANKNKLLKNVFKDLSPAGSAAAILPLSGIDPETKVHSVTKENRRKLAELLKSLPLTVEGLMGFDRAVVADGGVVLTEVDTKTMRSKKYPNLYLIGDLLHVTRPSGGYSLQLCWTTGYVAGSAV